MSYDLHFLLPDALIPTREALTAYFGGRAHYGTDDEQAELSYYNKDTGVYFQFGFENLADTVGEGHFLSFNMNFFRPHSFALEAEYELSAFVDYFKPRILDPQTEGMGNGSYNREGFLNGWNYGNKFAYSVFKEKSPSPPFLFPTADIERIWNWNYTRDALYEELKRDVFIPLIQYMIIDDQVKTFVIWGDSVPACLPEVDYIFIYKETVVPGSWFKKEKRENMIVPLPRDDVVRNLIGYEKAALNQFECWLSESETPDPRIVEWVGAIKPNDIKFLVAEPDSVMDAEYY